MKCCVFYSILLLGEIQFLVLVLKVSKIYKKDPITLHNLLFKFSFLLKLLFLISIEKIMKVVLSLLFRNTTKAAREARTCCYREEQHSQHSPTLSSSDYVDFNLSAKS